MKTALIIALVVLAMATGLPILVGMSGMAMCPDCDTAVFVGVCALAVASAIFAFAIALLAMALWASAQSASASLHSYLLERPPQPA